ncbi:MAG: HD domain-containing protein [Clostridiales bacterium]|nr:HD domain-containing protein [Clostridiales bacterium]
MQIKIDMPLQVKKAIDILNKNGYKGYIVGGCVRDSLLGREPEDFDLTTDASPDEMLECFKNYRTIDNGLKHGTLTVIIDGCIMEITTHRIDGDYTDNRRPDSVSFSRKLTDDLSRRDFTVNAMAYSEQTGLVDEFNSIEDLNNKIIRTVGNADKRFNEDALRIIRALRFASVLGFEIEEETKIAIIENRSLLNNIAVERIAAELNKLVCGDCLDVLLNYREVFAIFMPEFIPTFELEQNNDHHIYKVWEHIVRSVNFAPKDKITRLTMLFHDIGKGRFDGKDGHFHGHAEYSREMAQTILKRLKYDNDTINRVCMLVEHHDDKIEISESCVKRWLNRMGQEDFKRLLDVKKADNMAKAPSYHYRQKDIAELEKVLEKVIEEKQCFTLKGLAVNGNDVMALGAKNEKVGVILNELLRRVIDDEIENDREKLLFVVKTML